MGRSIALSFRIPQLRQSVWLRGADPTLFLWLWKKAYTVAVAVVKPPKVSAMAFSPDGSFFVTAGLRCVKFWPMADVEKCAAGMHGYLLGPGISTVHLHCVAQAVLFWQGSVSGPPFPINDRTLIRVGECPFQAPSDAPFPPSSQFHPPLPFGNRPGGGASRTGVSPPAGLWRSSRRTWATRWWMPQGRRLEWFWVSRRMRLVSSLVGGGGVAG